MNYTKKLIELWESYKKLHNEALKNTDDWNMFNKQYNALEKVAAFLASNSQGRFNVTEVMNWIITEPKKFEKIVYMN